MGNKSGDIEQAPCQKKESFEKTGKKSSNRVARESTIHGKK